MSPLEWVLSQLDDLHAWGDGRWTACCPACWPSTKRTLRLRETDEGEILLFCSARCDYVDILAQLDMEPRDLYRDEIR